ncbi:MAG TPA: hypothetical protein VNI02_24800 [Blastocatellia bacterium]|jgi:hypothetical protein|nr:hypothetical protein [Blastocatellia bacterium]
MSFNQAKKRGGQRANKQAARAEARGAGSRKLYSVPAWLNGRTFVGGFDLAGTSYKLTFAPSHAEAVSKDLQLRGRLTVADARGRQRVRDSVRITLASIQGGIGPPPIRRQVIAAGAQTGNIATSQQKQQVAGENEKRAGQKAEETSQPKASELPVTESTGPKSFTGVMYFHFEPLDGKALGVPADLGRVQMNLRLAPHDDTARALHSLYTAAVDALQGEQADAEQAAAIIRELNQLLSS